MFNFDFLNVWRGHLMRRAISLGLKSARAEISRAGHRATSCDKLAIAR